MGYIWNRDLETGHSRIDKQHKMLFDTLSCLGGSCRNGNGTEELERTIDFLIAYTHKHFADEEELQQRYNYPNYLRHKQYHDEFAGVVRGFAWQLAKDGYSFELVHGVYDILGNWLVHHIKGEDFALASYLRRFQNKSATSVDYSLPASPARPGKAGSFTI